MDTNIIKKETKIYVMPKGQSVLRIPINLARILDKDGWETEQVFIYYDRKERKLVVRPLDIEMKDAPEKIWNIMVQRGSDIKSISKTNQYNNSSLRQRHDRRNGSGGRDSADVLGPIPC